MTHTSFAFTLVLAAVLSACGSSEFSGNNSNGGSAGGGAGGVSGGGGTAGSSTGGVGGSAGSSTGGVGGGAGSGTGGVGGSAGSGTGGVGGSAGSGTGGVGGGALLQHDCFGYVVDRNVANNTPTGPNVFLSHGWSYVKDMRISNPGAGGYLYTVAAIPGYSGTIPGCSGRALCMESNVSTKQAAGGGGQTDFYLQLGSGSAGDIPANVWFQFWTYTNDYGSQRSKFARNAKFLYPSNNGYPSTSYPWLVGWGTAQHEVGNHASPELGYGAAAALWNRPPGADYLLASEYPTNKDKLGTNLSGAAGGYLPNTWYLTRIHIDTSGAQGVYEIWRRPMGTQTWTKTTEWIGGTTAGFSWPTPTSSRSGAKLLRMPTTWGVDADSTTNYDAWLYLADFSMATHEGALPTFPNY